MAEVERAAAQCGVVPYRIGRFLEGDAAALSLVATATFPETFAGLIDGEAIVSHCETKLCAARLVQEEHDGLTTTWIARHVDTEAAIGFAQLARSDLVAARNSDLELNYTDIAPVVQISEITEG